MAGKILNIEDLDKLIVAVKGYEETLRTNRGKLIEAGKACAWAMGEDTISKKQLKELEDALTSLDEAIQTTNNVIEALKYDRSKALEI